MRTDGRTLPQVRKESSRGEETKKIDLPFAEPLFRISEWFAKKWSGDESE